MKKVIGILILSLYSVVFSQHQYFTTVQKYTTENGLAGRFANYTFKDSRGIIWIGTQHGLHRFDGRDFKIFDEEQGLPFPEVMEIYEDTEGYLWLYRSCFSKSEDYCTKALVFFHRITHEILTPEERFGDEIPFRLHEIQSIHSDRSGQTFYIQTARKTYCWKGSGGFRQIQSLPLDRGAKIFKVLDDGRLGCIHQQDDVCAYFLLDSTGHKLSSRVISDGQKNTRDFTTFPSKGNFRLNLRDVIMYSKSREEVLVFDVNEKGELQENQQLTKMAIAVGRQARHTLFDEQYQSFWSADREGIIRTEVLPQKFRDVLAEDKSDMLWRIIPLRPGQFLLEKISNGYRIYLFDLNNPAKLSLISRRDHMKDGKGAIPFAEETDLENIERIFPLTSSELMFVRRDFEYKILKLEKFDEAIQVGKVQSAALIGDKILLGTLRGLKVFDIKTHKLSDFTRLNSFADFEESSIHLIEPVGMDSAWLGTNQGLFLLSLSRGVLAQYSPSQKGDTYLPTSTIYHFKRKGDGSFWLATRAGLVHWAGSRTAPLNNGKRFQLYTHKEGLPDKECVAVFEDKDHFIWVATIRGLVQLDPLSDKMRIYNRKDGLKQEYFLEYSHYQDEAGNIFLGGLNGLTYFDPADFKNTDFSSPDVPLIIVDFEQYNQQTERFEPRIKNLLEQGEIVLKPNERIFSLRLALADYRSAEKQQFSYRIPGYQEEWQTDISNVIRISGIPYGDYSLQIRGRLPNGQFSSHLIELPIHALRPFYLSIWFYAVLLFVVGFAAYSFYIARIRFLENRQKELEIAVSDRTAKIESDKQIIERQAEELRKLDQLKSRFFANVSHELRTPLTLILAPLQSVLNRGSLQEADKAKLSIAYKNGKRLLNLVNELLDLSKLESGKMKLQHDEKELFPFISRIVDSFESYARDTGIQLSLDFLPEKELSLRLDFKKTEIILLNLLSNALKFTPPGGSIVVKVDIRPEIQQVRILVSDTGRGIHPQDIPHIFNRFYQSEQTETAEGGTGIGLAISREFAKLMDGSLSVSSEWGKGSVFVLQLPLIYAKASPKKEELAAQTSLHAPSSPPRRVALNENQEHILLVEDNPDLRFFIQSLLDPFYQVTVAQHGQEALEKLSQLSNIDLIISDIMMPVMDGFQLLEKLKAHAFLGRIPVIMLTARADIKDKLKALRIGVDDYMLKPFEEEELQLRVENLLRNRKIREENRDNQPGPAMQDTEEQQWLQLVEETVTDKLSTYEFNVEKLAFEMAMSRQNLNIRIKKLTGLTASQYLQEARLLTARSILESRQVHAVKAAALEVGIKDVKYFSRKFKERFGKSPSAYL